MASRVQEGGTTRGIAGPPVPMGPPGSANFPLNSATALEHFISGNGEPRSISIHQIDTSAVTPTSFPGFRRVLRTIGPGSQFSVNTTRAFATRGDQAGFLGHITLRLTGVLETDPSGHWIFQGDLSADPDLYDFNQSTHRTPMGEASTTFGRVLGRVTRGTPYKIDITGSKPLTEFGDL